MPDDILVRRGATAPRTPTRRAGIFERGLLTARDGTRQHVVLVETDAHAEVELHAVDTDESLYVLVGRFEVVTPAGRVTVGPGDLCHFVPGSSHGLRCLAGPGRFLVVFSAEPDPAE